VIAYSDNAAVMEGGPVQRWLPQGFTNAPPTARATSHRILMKVETHNHPTAISPFPGASTGAGGEIRDEGATGRGAKPKAGLTGFTVSNLRLPGTAALGARPIGKPERIASALQIMIEARSAAPPSTTNSAGPTWAATSASSSRTWPACVRGYHKPIMIAGGLGSIQAEQSPRCLPAGTLLVQLGGPGMRIGMGGGAASSMAAGSNTADLDFDSVQRGNPEIQRRAQEVIDRCWQLGENNPILAIHDVGAGGISQRLARTGGRRGKGATFDLRKVPLEPGMAPGDLVQREPGALRAGHRPEPAAAVRGRCASASAARSPWSAWPPTTASWCWRTARAQQQAVDMPMDVLLGKPPKMHRDVQRVARSRGSRWTCRREAEQVAPRRAAPPHGGQQALPDHHRRPHGGRPDHRDQMVGPWQVPVADCAVTWPTTQGCAARPWPWASARRWPRWTRRPRAAWRWARPSPTCWPRRSSCRASSSAPTGWPPAASRARTPRCTTPCGRGHGAVPGAGHRRPGGQGFAVDAHRWPTRRRAAGHRAGVADRHRLRHAGRRARHAHAAAAAGRHHADPGRPGPGQNRLGGSMLAQVLGQFGDQVPDLDDPAQLKALVAAVNAAARAGPLLAYHDRSDGGLWAAVCEMAFAGHAA
jgi:phosphoribosylformylglycinamidine synthase